jgi:hypothetical protein
MADFATQYAHFNDDELLKLSTENAQLVPDARQALNEEIRRRGLVGESAEAGPATAEEPAKQLGPTLVNASTMGDAPEREVSSQARPAGKAGGWQALWFLLHVAMIYAITNFLSAWLSAWTRGTLLPLFHRPTSSSGFEFLLSHIFAFSFGPAFVVGLVNSRLKHRAAQFVWVIPTAIFAYKFLIFPAPSVFQSQFSAAFHQYFGGGFLIPEFRNWHDFWATVVSNPDIMRGKAQLDFTAPFYAGIGYSAAAWIGHRTNLPQKVSERVKNWEDSRFEHRP